VAIFRTVLRVLLADGDHELHIVQEDRADEVLVSVSKRSDEDKSVRLRPTVRIRKADATRIGKFLLGIREIDEGVVDVEPVEVEREVTSPGVGVDPDPVTES